MSSSSVCQGLQSCLEPFVIEPRVLWLKLAPQGNRVSSPSHSESQQHLEKPLAHHECDKKDTIPNVGGGWSFLQSLAHTSRCNNKTEDRVYVHPTVKPSSSVLSEKSLEMCTESLGSETGSNAGESSDDVSLFSFDTNTCSVRHTTTTTTTLVGTNTNCETKRVNRACNFPPPLTSITDFGGVHVKPRREGGRLILEAVASPSPRPYFHAERGDGRLRLCLFESFSASESDDDDEVGDGGEEGVVDEEEEGESEKNRGEEEEEEAEEEDTGAEEECVENVEDEMGVKKFARPSRCKESGNRDIFGDGLATLSFPLFLSVSE